MSELIGHAMKRSKKCAQEKGRVLIKHGRPRRFSYHETIRFHGHDGPFLALGYRLGKHLVRELKPKGIMDLRITVKIRAKKPYTCLVDGLQCATLATLGKGNLIVKNVPGRAIVVHAQRGSRVRKYAMTEPAKEICFAARDLQKAARRILRTPVSQMWRQLD